MPNRSKVSKQVSRRGGGYPKKTGKGTSLKKINIDKYRWEDDPDFKGTPGPYNPRSKKMKKKKYDYEVYQDLGPMGPTGTISYDADIPVAKREHIKAGRLSESSLTALEKKILAERDRRRKTGEDRATVVTDEERAKTKAARDKYLSDPQTGRAVLGNKKGGTVKKSKGGRVKNKHSGYQGHHGGNLVSKLYD